MGVGRSEPPFGDSDLPRHATEACLKTVDSYFIYLVTRFVVTFLLKMARAKKICNRKLATLVTRLQWPKLFWKGVSGKNAVCELRRLET